MDKIRAGDLQNLTNKLLIDNGLPAFDVWKTYLNLLFKNAPEIKLNLDGADYIYYTREELDFLSEMVVYLTSTPNIYIELYAWWLTVYTMIMSTTSDISDYITKQISPFVEHFNVVRPR